MTRILHAPEPLTFADLLDQLGQVAPERILLDPPPGRATEKDVLRLHTRENRLCELIDGVLVEKPMAFFEARGASVLGYYLEDYSWEQDLGIVLGADGMFRIMPHQVRIPDVAFVSWSKLPGRKFPKKRIPDLYPDLAVEVLSEGNTPQEMKRKLTEYFQVGVLLVWIVDLNKKTVTVFSSPTRKRVFSAKDVLTGGKVLPGFTLSLEEYFSRVGEKED